MATAPPELSTATAPRPRLPWRGCCPRLRQTRATPAHLWRQASDRNQPRCQTGGSSAVLQWSRACSGR
eukprot:7551654-Lingulodinium_polyedra.AAC.1